MEWNCKICTQPIADGEGYLSIDSALAFQRLHERKKWEAEHQGPIRLSEFMSFPATVHWVPAHTACYPQSGYDIPVEDARTAEHLLQWTAHLMGKNWLSCTDWDAVIRAAAQVRA